MSTEFTVSLQGKVVCIDPSGGELYCRGNHHVLWTNNMNQPVQLEFTEYLMAGESPDPKGLWPFTEYVKTERVTVDKDVFTVRIEPDATFNGLLGRWGYIKIKYRAVALGLGGAEPDNSIRALDPIIIVER